MPWRAVLPMDEKIRFIETFEAGVFNFTQLCAFFDISCKTGYKWVERWKAGGRPGLEDRSHATLSCPHRMRDDVAAVLLAIRRKHSGWGPAKLLRIVHKRRPSLPKMPNPKHSIWRLTTRWSPLRWAPGIFDRSRPAGCRFRRDTSLGRPGGSSRGR